MPAGWLTSREACERLGVRPQSLYAYVSRGLLTARKEGRRSLYDAATVEALAQRTARGRRPGRLEIHIDTEITLLDPAGKLYYRGVDVAEIAADWSFERTAAWLWSGNDAGEPSRPWAAPAEMLAAGRAVQSVAGPATTTTDRVRLVAAAAAATTRRGTNPAPAAVRADDARALITTIVESLPVLPGQHRPTAHVRIAERLWPRLTARRPTPDAIRALNAALVLLADHELAASTLAARVAASTGADTHNVVLAGLGTLAGPLHGAANRYARTLLEDAATHGPGVALTSSEDQHGFTPGTGHAVYRGDDPRADELLSILTPALPPAKRKVIAGVTETLRRRHHTPLNIDLALAALTYGFDMDPVAGDTIFAIARIPGWTAHATEEDRHALRYRPRAVYIGHRP